MVVECRTMFILTPPQLSRIFSEVKMLKPWLLLLVLLLGNCHTYAQNITSIVDYDVTIRFQGSVSCVGCKPEAKAEVDVSVRTANGSSSDLTDLGKFAVATGADTSLVKNYAWGRREKGSVRNSIEISFSIDGCAKRTTSYVLEDS